MSSSGICSEQGIQWPTHAEQGGAANGSVTFSFAGLLQVAHMLFGYPCLQGLIVLIFRAAAGLGVLRNNSPEFNDGQRRSRM